MASDRIRSKSTIGTRLSSLETAAENAAKSDNVGELSALESRVSKLESLTKDLSSFNWRLEQEYPSMDERYALAGEGGGGGESSTQVTDWDLATEPGNYWSYQGGTINGPVSAWLVGVVEDFGSGGNRVRVQSVYIANASEGQSGYGTVWRRYYNVSTSTFATTWAPLMPPPHTHTRAQITDFAHTHTRAQITDFAHTHTRAQITDFAHTHDWSDVTAYPDTGNLFRNGYFGWGLTDWTVPADVTASVVTVTDGPNGQSTSVLRATPLDSDGGIVNVLPSGTAEGQVIPGMTYDFVLVARVVSGSTGNCRIRLGFQSTGLSNQWPTVDGTNLAGSSTNGVWQTLAGSYTVSPTEPRERMSASIHFSGNNGSTTYEIASVVMVPRGIGSDTPPTPPTLPFAVRDSGSAYQSVNSGANTLAHTPDSVEMFGGIAQYGTYGFTVPVDGWYRVEGGAMWMSMATVAGYREVYITAGPTSSGSKLAATRLAPVAGVDFVTYTSSVVYLTAGSTVSMRVRHTQGAAVNVAYKQLSVTLIR